MNLLMFLGVGLVAGWLASVTARGQGGGVFANLVLGVLGAFVGTFLFRVLNLPAEGLAMSLVAAFVGSVAVLLVASVLRRPF